MKTLDVIRERIGELSQRIDSTEVTLRALREEREELAKAVEVFSRFADDEELAPAPGPNLEGRRVESEVPKRMDEKPDGTPTLAEMILQTLSEANTRGVPSMAPKEITAAIRQRWWPAARAESVGSVAWRMADRKQLAKEDGRYSLPSEPSGELFASHTEVAA